MFKRLLGISAAFVVLGLMYATPSAAQVFVVQNCGTVPASMKVLSAGNPGMFFTDTTGVLCTSSGGGGGGGTSSSFGSAFPTPGTAAGFTDGTNMVAGRVRNPGSSALVGDAAVVVADPNVLAAINAAVPAGTNTIGNVGPLAYPVGATPITASATGTTGATTATLAGTSGKTTYICGYSIRANATAATTVTNTLTGVVTATMSSTMWIAPAASGIGIDEQIFQPCIPASATNTAIAAVSGAPGSGGNVSSKAWGYQL